ncbi:MAG: hypothetical protein MJZ81_04700 [Bacteroidales bacterium]|nr:hypothetical protein [Bacteroidales bacterium]
MFESLKKRHQNKVIRILTEPLRIKRIENLSDIKEIGIIFTRGSEQEWNQISDFAKRMESKGKIVRYAGIQDDKESYSYIIASTETTLCHDKKDLDFFGIPRAGVLDDFIKHRYDLVIDTTVQPNFFALYTAAKTLSDLRITYLHSAEKDCSLSEKVFDMIFREDKPIDIKTYLSNIENYLNQIKK